VTEQLIFQLGSNNWQRQGEFAPGSGILHEAHHIALNGMDGVSCYSVFPSKNQTSDDPKVRVFELDHDIPICESISPISSYRFHSMSEEEFEAYVDRVQAFAMSCIDEAEEREGRPVTLAVAHHTFINPLVLSRINREREAAGRPQFKLVCFVHGTALKMFAHEKAGTDPEYPARFLPYMIEADVFTPGPGVDACAAISKEQLANFGGVFEAYPKDRMILSPNGYDTSVFKPNPACYSQRHEILESLKLAESPVPSAPMSIDTRPDKVVSFCGKFADWKRLDAVLQAASKYEKSGNIATLIIGSGPDEAIAHYHGMAYDDLQLQNTWFLGPRPHAEIARLNALADVGVYPSRGEPFGLVLIEAMGCGTPVIGANSGGPKDFVTDEVGALVPECEGDDLVNAIVRTVDEALSQDWKSTKGVFAAQFAAENFSVVSQCRNLLKDLGL
jgi:glycosyltransferase involved in cell wall biosynthesis